MKICFISDTHNSHSRITIPECDLIVHTGDATFQGYEHELVEFNHWIKSLNKPFIFVPGNHDRMFENHEHLARAIVKDAIVLINQSYEFKRFKFYGSPVTPFFHNWAFNRLRGPDIKRYWADIPVKTEILLTHGPAMGIMDEARGHKLGCEELRIRLGNLKKLKIHAFGHIHEGYGSEMHKNVWHVNASICDGKYKPINKPILIEMFK